MSEEPDYPLIFILIILKFKPRSTEGDGEYGQHDAGVSRWRRF